ncbi:MAG: RNA polymerase sigma factor [Bacteroidia bacterium]
MDSIKQLFRYYPVVRKYIRANSGTNTEAEDVFQDALLIYLERVNAPGFNLTSTRETYLFGICKNLWYTELKKKGRMPLQGQENLPDVSFSTEENPEEEKIKRAQQAVEFLEEKCRLILNLFYNQKTSLAEIARKLKLVSETAARNQKFQCLEKARKRFKELDSIKE